MRTWVCVNRVATTAMAAALIVFGAGCQGVPTCGDIEALTEDAGGDGFMDVTPPAGVVFDPETTIKFLGGNTLVPADLLPHVEEVNLDAGFAQLLIDSTNFMVRFSLTLDYGDAGVQTICQTEPFSAFEFKVEAACPVDTELTVEVIAVLPIGGGIPVATIPIGLTTDAADFTCGQTVSLVTTKNEAGEVV